MGRAAGYIVQLASSRRTLFEDEYEDGGIFAEPVGEFSHSRNSPLLCFITSTSGEITHIALGKRGRLAGTNLRRLNLEQTFKLQKVVRFDSIYEKAPSKVEKKLLEKLTHGGLLPPMSFQALIEILIHLAPETTPIIRRFSEERLRRIEGLPTRAKIALAEQKEAVATALTIAGIERDELLGWDLDEKNGTSSFLDGLEQARLREDPMVINDLLNLSGFEAIKSTPYNSVIFENDQSKLTVLLANRLL